MFLQSHPEEVLHLKYAEFAGQRNTNQQDRVFVLQGHIHHLNHQERVLRQELLGLGQGRVDERDNSEFLERFCRV